MYKLNGNTITKQQADDTASFYDMSTEDYAAKNNWVLDEGEPKDEPKKTKTKKPASGAPSRKPAMKCKCGSTTHARISYTGCPLNKASLAAAAAQK